MRQIFVLGGGGFSMEPENPLLDRHLLSLSQKMKPKICFIGTASGDSDGYRDRFYGTYRSFECEPTHLSLFKPPTRDLASFVADQDILFVGGGNTKNLICLWREWRLDQAIRQAYENGVILSGISAGMICWFEQGLTDSFGEGLEPLECLGFLKGSACPHFDGEAERRPTYLRMIEEKKMKGGLALDDGAAALFIDENLSECVSSRPKAKGFFFESESARERAQPVRYLG